MLSKWKKICMKADSQAKILLLYGIILKKKVQVIMSY